MLTYYLSFAIVCMFLTIINWRLGLWLMLVVGLLADPLRKLTPGNPVYISIVFVGILAILYLACKKTYARGQSIFAIFPRIKSSMQLFAIFFIINAIRPILESIHYLPLVLYSSAQYIGLFAAAKLGFDLVEDEKSIIKFADIFVITLLPFLFSVLLHFWGFDSIYPVLGVMEFEGQIYYQHHAGQPLAMLCGVFRNPEGMGWFAMVVSVSAFFLLVRKKKNILNILYYSGSFLLSSFCVLLSGRRKFFLGIFIYTFIFIVVTMRKNMKRAIMYLVLFFVAGGVFFYYIGRAEQVAVYLKSGQSGFEASEGRLQKGVLYSIVWAVERDGFFGRGLGSATQGARHFNKGIIKTSGIEAGPGKVIAELGVPGAVAFIMVLLSYFAGVYKQVIKGWFKDMKEVTGVFLLALVLTQMAEFSVSHQIYGDPLVAVLTGLMCGFLLAIPRIREAGRVGDR
ncbi:MAG: hypothetical protein D4S01_04470 [Dehalococcoidia bacterium]|nr:MAG: hypothetical protein D4S01_04470 [Dehalococcoidia bacterium]